LPHLEVPDLPCRYIEKVLPPGKVVALGTEEELEGVMRAHVQILGEPARARFDGTDPRQSSGIRLPGLQIISLRGESVRLARFIVAAPGEHPPHFPSGLGIALYSAPDG
jgi:hypothetical protein